MRIVGCLSENVGSVRLNIDKSLRKLESPRLRGSLGASLLTLLLGMDDLHRDRIEYVYSVLRI